jgi:hypothetical protein
MSYIINNSSAFVNIKLTDIGRRKLAEGKLNFTAWGIGDSELNYGREEIVDNNPTDPQLSDPSKVLRPVDRQPNIVSFISVDGATPVTPLNAAQISTLKAIVVNKAAERGFFSANTTHTEFTTILGTGTTFDDECVDVNYTVDYGCVDNSYITGGTVFELGSGYTYNVGDYILIKYSNDTLGNLSISSNNTPQPALWYRIEASGSTYVEVDRELPNLAVTSLSADTCFIIYPQGEVYDAYGYSSTIPYWNTGTLSFDTCCEVSCGCVPVWNMNNVWCEDLAGMTGSGINNIVATPNESYEKFGSWQYLGQKYPYLNYPCDIVTGITIDICDIPGQSVSDPISKSISILHYTNNAISSYYGEFLFIDGTSGKNLYVHMPDLMYHRRDFPTASGTSMGMSFLASGATKMIPNTDIEYIDLIEDPSLIAVGRTSLVVGKVFPQLKIVAIDDDEIVAAMSYKSNRNWTLPSLTANLVSASGGTNAGILPTNQYMWLTYTFENTSGSGLTTTLPCQYYTIMANNTSSSKDVEFKISDVDFLPYMRKEEYPGYDGMGFSARDFKVLYQIVSGNTRPVADAWKVHDFTSTNITVNAGETIDPLLLENQNPTALGFKLGTGNTVSDSTFSIIESLSMAANTNPTALQFGDERFFYGNLDTYIGANVYKTIFRLSVPADIYKFTSNVTRSTDPTTNPPVIKVTECGIYDNVGNLVMIGKFSRPVKLNPGNTVLFELSMDF